MSESTEFTKAAMRFLRLHESTPLNALTDRYRDRIAVLADYIKHTHSPLRDAALDLATRVRQVAKDDSEPIPNYILWALKDVERRCDATP